MAGASIELTWNDDVLNAFMKDLSRQLSKPASILEQIGEQVRAPMEYSPHAWGCFLLA